MMTGAMAEPTLGTRTMHEGDRVVSHRVRKFRLHYREQGGGTKSKDFGSQLVRVGSRTGNDLVLADRTVSRIHLEIAADEHGYRLRDLGSSNGTVVDGYRTHDIYLRAGSRIAIGRSELRFEPL